LLAMILTVEFPKATFAAPVEATGGRVYGPF
jgi:hypothetical protein